MFEETLFGNTKEILAILGRSGVLAKAYLAGGTALALQLGHRISVDIDFFTPRPFDPESISEKLSSLLPFKVEQLMPNSLLGSFGEIKFSLLLYKYPVILRKKNFLEIRLLDAREIGAMMVAAIGGRGTKRDFVDAYFICKECCPLKELIELYGRKFGSLATDAFHIQKSLVYFADAEKDAMPRMLKPVKWKEVKNFFESEVRALNDFWRR